jgi:hypothetical protein
MRTGTIYLPTFTAVALWNKELTGQLSDGMWENANPAYGPDAHWIFWCNLQAVCDPGGEPRVVTPCAWRCKKTGYNFAALYPIIGERMLSIGYEEIKRLDGPDCIPLYTMRELRQDIKSIKAAMKTVNR